MLFYVDYLGHTKYRSALETTCIKIQDGYLCSAADLVLPSIVVKMLPFSCHRFNSCVAVVNNTRAKCPLGLIVFGRKTIFWTRNPSGAHNMQITHKSRRADKSF